MSGNVKMVLSTLLFVILVAALGFWLFFEPLLITKHVSKSRDEIIGRIEQLEDRIEEGEENDAGKIE